MTLWIRPGRKEHPIIRSAAGAGALFLSAFISVVPPEARMKAGNILISSVLGLMLAACAAAGGVTSGKEHPAGHETIRLPFPFYSEAFGVAGGYVYGITGVPQKQARLLATAMAGTEGSARLSLAGRGMTVLGMERLLFESIVGVGYIGKSKMFIDGNPDFPEQRAGENGSDPDNYITGKGWDNQFRLVLKYLLPVGHGDSDRIGIQREFERGLLISGATGGESWNPFRSGKTFLEMAAFYRCKELKSDEIQDAELQTNGMGVALTVDNRDYPANPSKGYSFQVRASRDFGRFGSTDSWTSYQIEYDQYVSLGQSRHFRQSVLALDVWVAHTPTWEISADGIIHHRPPPFAGATLGGRWRLRGYASRRFSDRAAICYAMELRLVPAWNPFESWGWLQDKIGVQWVQCVPFVEVGRVAPTLGWSGLHENMRWDAGLGFRLSARGAIVRIDQTASDEGLGTRLMIGQPFQM